MFRSVFISNVLNTARLFQQHAANVNVIPKRLMVKFLDLPKIGRGKSFRRIVHYPEEYTVRPLQVTNLAGRDPVSGRKVVEGLGGGIKHKYHWIKWTRDGPSEGPPQEEKVIKIIDCGCRTSKVALVAVKDQIKYILATANMKAGDIIRTSTHIPKNAVQASEGDAYPVGALPIGTKIHNLQLFTTSEVTIVHSAGCFATIKGHIDDKVVVLLPSKQEVLVDKKCMATVGVLSNVEHSSIPIGSAQKLRELGYRPRSGLWHRKTGQYGRKIKPPKPMRVLSHVTKETSYVIKCAPRKFQQA